jgi:uncharacterized protein
MTSSFGGSESRRLALITGASSGIGYELAREFAIHGFDLVVCSQSRKLETAAAALREFGTSVKAFRADLSDPDGVEALYEKVRSWGQPLDALAINAGVGVGGDFVVETNLQAEMNLIRLNVFSAVHLAKRILPDMLVRGSGRILFTSSIEAGLPVPFEAVYGGSKAFLDSFASAIQRELRETNVRVTILMPGPTETDFYRRAGLLGTKVGDCRKDDPADVARAAFEGLMAGRARVVVPSPRERLLAAGDGLLRRLTAQIYRRNTSSRAETG